MNKEKLIIEIFVTARKSRRLQMFGEKQYVDFELVKEFIQSEPEETCTYDLWDEDSDTYKCSQCGELWTLIADSPLENNMNYCPKCGRKIKAGE